MEYEYITHQKGLPFKLFLVSIGFRTFHLHAEHELIYVLKGSIDILHNTHTTKVVQGDFVAINGYHVHGIQQTDTENLLLIIQFKPQTLTDLETNRILPSYPLTVIGQDTPFALSMATLIKHMYLKSLHQTQGSRMTLMGYYYLLVGNLLDYLEATQTTPTEIGLTGDDINRISQIIDFVESNFQDKIGLQSLSDSLHINKFHLSHFITKKMGISFQNYLNSVRLSHALNLMSRGDLKILDIALKSGFSDHKYLNKLIKDTFNCTPKAYQKKILSYAFDLPSAPIGSLHLPFNEEEARSLISTPV